MIPHSLHLPCPPHQVMQLPLSQTKPEDARAYQLRNPSIPVVKYTPPEPNPSNMTSHPHPNSHLLQMSRINQHSISLPSPNRPIRTGHGTKNLWSAVTPDAPANAISQGPRNLPVIVLPRTGTSTWPRTFPCTYPSPEPKATPTPDLTLRVS